VCVRVCGWKGGSVCACGAACGGMGDQGRTPSEKKKNLRPLSLPPLTSCLFPKHKQTQTAAALSTAAAATLSRAASGGDVGARVTSEAAPATSPGSGGATPASPPSLQLRRIHSRVSDDPVVDVVAPPSGPASPSGEGGGGGEEGAGGPPPPASWNALVRRVHTNKISLHAPPPVVAAEAPGGAFPADPAAPPARSKVAADRFRAAGAAVRAGVRARRAAAETAAAAAAAAAATAAAASDDVVGEIHFSGGSARLIQRVTSRSSGMIPEAAAAAAEAAAAAH
jgi:hypothetical protein